MFNNNSRITSLQSISCSSVSSIKLLKGLGEDAEIEILFIKGEGKDKTSGVNGRNSISDFLSQTLIQ